MCEIWKKIDEPLDPRPLFTKFQERFPTFNSMQQHDTHEAVLCIIDAFEKSLGKEFINSIFYGNEDQVITYPGGSSTRTQEFMSLFVDSPLSEYNKYHILDNYVDEAGKTYHVAALQSIIKKTGECLTITFTQKCAVKDIPLEYMNCKIFALVIHWGISNGGHYAAYTKHKGKWYLVDDETKTEVDTPDENAPCSMVWYKK